MNIYLIRHGRQSSALCNVNVELSEQGHKQAELVAKRLSSEFYHLQGLYSSTLIRAVMTAEHISNYTGLPIRQFPDIEEMHFGDWEGKSDKELDAQYAVIRREHSLGIADITYPGGENGRQCFERFSKGMKRIIDDAVSHQYDNIAIVTHGVAMRAFLCGTFDIPLKKRGILARSLENGSITHLTYEPRIGYTLERFNDYAHLEPYDELLRKHFIQKS